MEIYKTVFKPLLLLLLHDTMKIAVIRFNTCGREINWIMMIMIKVVYC